MAVNRLLIDIAPSNFPVLSSTHSTKNVLFPNSDRVDSKQTPSWIENYWPMPSANQAAIVEVSGFIQDLPQEILDQLDFNYDNVYTVEYRGYRSIMLETGAAWHTRTDTGWVTNKVFPISSDTSVARLKGETYMCTLGSELYTYADPIPEVEPNFTNVEVVATVGIDFTEMISMCAAVSYLIATDGETVYWNSPLNPIYWTPGGVGDDAGAGATKVLAVKGQVNHLQQAVDGFYLMTDTNIIRARYTGNADNPWSFREVSNSSGVFYRKNIAGDTNLETLFCWSNYGMGAIRDNRCTYAFEEVTDFVSGDVIEFFDPITNSVTKQYGVNIDFSVHFLTGRYLAISYGLEGQVRQFILLYDTLEEKWTRIRLDHITLLNARTLLIPDALIFDNWLDTFGETEYTFDEMLGNSNAGAVEAASITVLRADGVFVELTPVDIFTEADIASWLDYEYRVLDRAMLWNDMRLTRTRDTELSEISLFYRYPTFPDPLVPDSSNVLYSKLSDPAEPDDTELIAFSDSDPTQRTYLLARANGNNENYVERVVGQEISLAIKNTSSLQGVEVGIVNSGRRR